MNKNKLLSSNDTVKSTNINKKIKVLFIVIAMILSIITINFGISKFRLASKNTVELKFYEYKIAENEIQVSPQEYTQQAVIKITTQKPGTKIQYKLADDSDWISYTNEFVINNNTTISARLVGITEQFEGPVTKKSVTNIAVAKIGEKTYKTVKEAIADCEENAENTETKIEMLADVVEAFEIPVGKNIVLDLNGKTITSDANALTESGNLEATAVVKGTFKLINSEQVENSNQSSSNEQNPKGKLVSQTGIAIKVINQGNFTLGIKETQSEEINVSKVNPVIIGKTNGVVVEDGGKFNFYDGKIISTTTEENVHNSIIGNITETPTNYIAIPKKEGEYEVSTLEKQYIVTFDANGGIASFNTKLVITNQPYGTLPVVEKKEGYEFVCWERKLTETTTETITDTTIVSTQADHIIKAKWNANTYEINYNSNGATGTLENTACTYDKEFTIIQSTPLTKAGYTFKEWNTKQDGTGIAYMPEQKAKNLTSVNNSIVTLYAIWQDTIVPTNTAPTATSTTNTITVQNNQTDEGSGINKSTIEYAICLGENSDGTKQWSKWQSSNIFEQLKSNTQYGIKTKVIDNAGNGPVESEIGIISTQDITNGTLEFYKDTEQGEIIVPETNSSDKLKYINSNIYIKITQSITGTTSYTVKTPEETITTYTENTVISTCAGQYEITLTTTDGTNSKSEKYYINIDKTPPTSIPTYTSTTNTVTVNANAVDDESGVGELVYTIKKEGVELETNTIGEFSGLEDNNTYEVVIIMKDKLENVSTITTTVKTSKLQPGELEFEKSSTSTKFNASNTEDNNVWINENVNISIIESIPGTTTTYMVEKVGETGTKYTENAIITTTDGTYKITLETTDGNNVENVVYYFNIDKTPPTLTLSKITHKDGVYGEDLYNEFYIINIQQSDNSEIDVTKYELGIQTTEYFKTNGTEITENSINVTENGTYTIYTKDIAGNETVKAIEITNIGYDVVYDLNGGTSTQPIANQVKIKGSNLTLTDAKPTKEGYQFKGWATTTNATVPEYVSSGLYTQESKITLYAVWEEVVASATIGEITTYYKSVQTAIEAVSSNNGAIVTLVKNEIHENITVANGQNIILNTNGKTLKPAEGTEEIVISNYGTLTIEGNGIIVNESVDNRCVINNNGNLNLNEIRLKSTNGVAVNNTSTGSININGTEIETSGVGVCNYGNTTVSNGTIIGGIEVNSGKVTVTGGTVGSSNTTYGISAITSGTVIIGDKTTAVDNSVPCIIGKNIGVYVGGTARLEFYDGSIIGESGEGSAINGTVNAIPSGFEVDKVVETVDGVSREIARLSTVAELSSGMVVNAKMKKLSGTANASYSTSNTNIQAILKSDIAPDISTMTSDNIVSNSTIPIYMWFDNGTIYWWSEANKIKCNEFSRSMFYFFHELANIDGISSWDTSSVTNMSYMFYYCRTLTNIEALASWNTSSVTDMSYMFYYCRTLANIEALASWNTSSVINMSNMFYNCRTLTNIEALASWNTSSVINMSNMFYNCNTLTNIEALASWDTSSVTNMSNMFYNCNTLTNIEALASWDTSSVTNMSSMFSGCNTLTNIEALASWDTSSVTNMSSMFSGCNTLTNIEALASWNTSSVTDMRYMFYYCRTLANIEALASWDTSSVTNMSYMFYYCRTLANIEALASWNTSSVTNMSNMFYNCNTLTNIEALASWNTSSVINMSNMFSGCNTLTNIEALASWNTSSVINMSNMFSGCNTLANIEALASWNTSSVINMSNMFYNCNTLTNIEALASWNTSSVINMSNMFSGCNTLANIEALASWNTSSVINMSNMFYNCNTLTNIEALASWNTSSVTNMSNMFYNCNTLTNIEALASWNTSSVTNMSNMFYGCNTLTNTEALASWNTSSVTNMSYMFSGCNTLTNIEALASWNTSSVTNMSNMFLGCNTLTNIEALASWNTSSVIDMNFMFNGCETLTNIEALASWDTSSVTGMGYMFSSCRIANFVPISNWNISKVTYFFRMLSNVATPTTYPNWNGTWSSDGTFTPATTTQSTNSTTTKSVKASVSPSTTTAQQPTQTTQPNTITNQQPQETTQTATNVITTPVAQIGTTKYATIAEAINSSTTPITIEILENITLTDEITIDSGKNITLKLNTKTLSSTAINTIVNNGILTIDSTGIIKNEQTNGIVIQNTGTLNLQKGIITTAQNGGKGIYNQGVLQISGGKIVTEGVGAIGIYNANISENKSNKNTQSVSTKISGGIIETTGYSSKGIYNNSYLEVIENTDKTVIPKVIISGDDSIGIYNSEKSAKCDMKSGEIIIKEEVIENYELIKNSNEFKAELEQKKPSYGIYNKANIEVNLEKVIIKAERLKSIGVCNNSEGAIVFGKNDGTVTQATPIIYAITDYTSAIANINNKKGKIKFYDGTFSTLNSIKELITDVLENYKMSEDSGNNVINTTLVIE